jgi:SDR family mycofactocin-dependent oxidoreductase
MGMLEGKVAFITGAARGQGRSHAVRLAAEGADIICMDLCEQPSTTSIPGATRADLEETVRLVEAQDRRIFARQGDIRDIQALDAIVREGIAELGRLDIVLANAGIWGVPDTEPEDLEQRGRFWSETIDINLSGQWNTVDVAVPYLVEQGEGGAIVLTSSVAGLRGMPLESVAQTAYVAAKHGVIGLMRNVAMEQAQNNIRVNTVNPTTVATPMILNEFAESYGEKKPELSGMWTNLIDVPAVDPVDISNAILYLVSDLGRYVTGVALPVDAGFLLK